ncbi:MAG: FMN-binding protein [Firmicutes bacterium HGW-Firmicutes-11]|jgi:uncharacterized protein with FMN-binding domain|nr:MAG: FMN-binding protein [Firmicutes bacterium HGW-Firmicutes-11]
MKKIVKALGIVILMMALILAGGIYYLTKGLDEGASMSMEGIPVLPVDGTYIGAYHNGRWTNELQVVIKGNRIEEIEILDDVTFVKTEVSTELFQNVVAAQDTRVDVVSGATVTSNAYLMAIEDALE